MLFIKILGTIYFALIVVSLFATTISTINLFRNKETDIFKELSLFEKIMNILLVIILIPFIPILSTIEYCKKII